MIEIVYTDQAKEDFEYWKNNNPQKLKKIFALLENIQQTPFSGIGKPEPLKYEYAGKWSRRIDNEHRLVYSIENDNPKIIYIYSARYHYS